MKKKQNTTHQQIDGSAKSEIELVEENVGPPEEEVENLDETRGSSVVPEVSVSHLFEMHTHQYLGRRP